MDKFAFFDGYDFQKQASLWEDLGKSLPTAGNYGLAGAALGGIPSFLYGYNTADPYTEESPLWRGMKYGLGGGLAGGAIGGGYGLYSGLDDISKTNKIDITNKGQKIRNLEEQNKDIIRQNQESEETIQHGREQYEIQGQELTDAKNKLDILKMGPKTQEDVVKILLLKQQLNNYIQKTITENMTNPININDLLKFKESKGISDYLFYTDPKQVVLEYLKTNGK